MTERTAVAQPENGNKNEIKTEAFYNIQNELEKVPESKFRIRFVDCDPFGHLNNARYLDYFISAREEHLMAFYELDIYGPRFSQRNWVVKNSQLTYLEPALNNETVVIQTRLLKAGSSSIIVEAAMLSEDKKRIKATAWLEFRYFDLKKGRPIRHDEELMDFFTSLEVGGSFAFGAERKRVKELKTAVA